MKYGLTAALSTAAIALSAAPAHGQEYPARPIRVVTGGVGGGNDLTARLVAQGLSTALSQQVIVDNRASSIVPGEIVSRAQPDGYTLLSYGNSIWIGQLLRGNMVYDPVRDFTPITSSGKAPNILVVHPSVPAKSVQELIAFAKAKPGTLNYSSGATGSSSHLTSELLKAMAGINIVRISYKSGATEMADLIGGQVQMTFASASVMPHVKSGKLRALAIASAKPSALVPGLPTMASSGLPEFESGSNYGVFGPAKMPAAVVRRLNQEIVRFLNTPATQERFLGAGIETGGVTPEQYTAEVKSEMARWGKLIKDAGIREE